MSNLGYVTTPGTFEGVVELLILELQRRGLYPGEIEEGLTARERIYGKGQRGLRDDHAGRSISIMSIMKMSRLRCLLGMGRWLASERMNSCFSTHKLFWVLWAVCI